MDKVKANKPKAQKLDNPETKYFVYQSSHQTNKEVKDYSLSKEEQKYLTKNLVTIQKPKES